MPTTTILLSASVCYSLCFLLTYTKVQVELYKCTGRAIAVHLYKSTGRAIAVHLYKSTGRAITVHMYKSTGRAIAVHLYKSTGRTIAVLMYKSTGRSVAVTTASVSALVKVFSYSYKRLYLLNLWMEIVHTFPDVRYWCKVLCFTTPKAKQDCGKLCCPTTAVI